MWHLFDTTIAVQCEKNTQYKEHAFYLSSLGA